MNFIKATIVGAEFKELLHPPTIKHIFAEVVLIDRSYKGAESSAFGLVNEELTAAPSYVTPDAFTMLGGIQSIDKQKKQIVLKSINPGNEASAVTIVTYRHLIVASGVNHNLLASSSQEEFSAGLAALLDAIKMRKNVPEQLSELERGFQSNPTKKHQFLKGFDSKEIEQLSQSFLTQNNANQMPHNLASFYKRLYEVQIGA